MTTYSLEQKQADLKHVHSSIQGAIKELWPRHNENIEAAWNRFSDEHHIFTNTQQHSWYWPTYYFDFSTHNQSPVRATSSNEASDEKDGVNVKYIIVLFVVVIFGLTVTIIKLNDASNERAKLRETTKAQKSLERLCDNNAKQLTPAFEKVFSLMHKIQENQYARSRLFVLFGSSFVTGGLSLIVAHLLPALGYSLLTASSIALTTTLGTFLLIGGSILGVVAYLYYSYIQHKEDQEKKNIYADVMGKAYPDNSWKGLGQALGRAFAGSNDSDTLSTLLLRELDFLSQKANYSPPHAENPNFNGDRLYYNSGSAAYVSTTSQLHQEPSAPPSDYPSIYPQVLVLGERMDRSRGSNPENIPENQIHTAQVYEYPEGNTIYSLSKTE